MAGGEKDVLCTLNRKRGGIYSRVPLPRETSVVGHSKKEGRREKRGKDQREKFVKEGTGPSRAFLSVAWSREAKILRSGKGKGKKGKMPKVLEN